MASPARPAGRAEARISDVTPRCRSVRSPRSAGEPSATEYEAGEGLDHLGFNVPDLEKAIDDARKAGYPVVQEIRTPNNRWVYLRDPNGIGIELSAGAEALPSFLSPARFPEPESDEPSNTAPGSGRRAAG